MTRISTGRRGRTASRCRATRGITPTRSPISARCLRSPAARRRHTGRRAVAVCVPSPLAGIDVQFPELTTVPASDGFQHARAVPQTEGLQSRPEVPRGPVRVWRAQCADGDQRLAAVHALQPVLADAGYVVVQVDNRAATGISKTPREHNPASIGGAGIRRPRRRGAVAENAGMGGRRIASASGAGAAAAR